MRINRLSGVRVLFNLVSFVASTLAPTFAYSQALTPVQSGTRYAGTITPGFNGDFGSATTVSLNTPSYIVFDSHGNQYISDTLNNCVRKIDTSGSMSTLVGLAVSGKGDTCNTSSNSTPTPSQGLYQPTGLAVDSSNNLYIADSSHNCVRMLANGSERCHRSHHRRRHLRLHIIDNTQPQRPCRRRQQQSLHLHSGHRRKHLSGPSPGAEGEPLRDGRHSLCPRSECLLRHHRQRRAQCTLRPGYQWHGRSLHC